MTYHCSVNGKQTTASVEREGLRFDGKLLDFADVSLLTPMNHRVWIDTLQGDRLEISMLGFSYDGFWEELSNVFADRSLAALFVENAPIMRVEGEYETTVESGRAILCLFADAICILPQTEHAVRIPLCYVDTLTRDGYRLTIRMRSGDSYAIGKMGYDTQSFFERAQKAMNRTKAERAKLLSGLRATAPFTQTGLFRTTQKEFFWQAAYGKGRCAVELSTGEDAATYLYRFEETEALFSARLEEAMEAMGPHREIIYLPDAQLAEKPLYRMAVRRCPAVQVLRARSDGRLIHSASHAEKLSTYLKD